MSQYLNPNTTLAVVNATATLKTLYLISSSVTLDAANGGRIVYVKGSQDSSNTSYLFDIKCSTGVSFYPSFSNKLNIAPFYCASLLEYPTNVYNILNYYLATFTDFVTSPSPGTTVVNVSGNNSILFVDLQTQAKTLVLPSINSLAQTSSQAPYFIIKDAYLSAGTNNLFISSSGAGETFDSKGSCLRIQSSGSSIQLAGDSVLNRWHILSYS